MLFHVRDIEFTLVADVLILKSNHHIPYRFELSADKFFNVDIDYYDFRYANYDGLNDLLASELG